MKTYFTYDYDAQQWVDDPKAYVRQLTDELALLESPDGEDYAAMINAPRAPAITAIKELLHEEQYNAYAPDAEMIRTQRDE